MNYKKIKERAKLFWTNHKTNNAKKEALLVSKVIGIEILMGLFYGLLINFAFINLINEVSIKSIIMCTSIWILFTSVIEFYFKTKK